MASSPGLVLSYWMAMLLRFYLISDTKLELSERVEIATPINSFKRLSEGVALYRQGRSNDRELVFRHLDQSFLISLQVWIPTPECCTTRLH